MQKTRIAHFTIGFPPLKGGGLVQYVVDLMDKQLADSSFEFVTAFYPGRFTVQPRLSLRKVSYKHHTVIEIINPTPATLTEGTRYPLLEICNNQEKIILDKLIELRINLVHFHTFFGISADLVRQIKKAGITTIYSAHDYQPLCPKLHLLDYALKICHSTEGGQKCTRCNYFSLNYRQIALRNSRLGLALQGSPKIKTFVKGHLLRKRSDISLPDRIDDQLASEYQERRNNYINLLNNYIDLLFYGSAVVEKYFKLCGVEGPSAVIPSSNTNINKFNRGKHQFTVDLSTKKQITFGYLGGNRLEKGYPVLLQAFGDIYQTGLTGWRLLLFSDGARRIVTSKMLQRNVIKMGYQKGNVFDSFDILIVPSIWPETFGIVVAEALAANKMVIASDLVGGAHYFKNTGLMMYRHSDPGGLRAVLEDTLINRPKFRLQCGDLIDKCNFDNHYAEIKKYLVHQ